MLPPLTFLISDQSSNRRAIKIIAESLPSLREFGYGVAAFSMSPKDLRVMNYTPPEELSPYRAQTETFLTHLGAHQKQLEHEAEVARGKHLEPPPTSPSLTILEAAKLNRFLMLGLNAYGHIRNYDRWLQGDRVQEQDPSEIRAEKITLAKNCQALITGPPAINPLFFTRPRHMGHEAWLDDPTQCLFLSVVTDAEIALPVIGGWVHYRREQMTPAPPGDPPGEKTNLHTN